MADASAIARPYAKAIFEVAQSSGELSQWSDRLALVSAVIADPTMHALIGSPRIDHQQLADVVVGVCGDKLNDAARNAVKLIAENGRLEHVPDIAEHYEALRAEAERMVEAELQTAVNIDEQQQQRFAAALEQRLGRTVKLVCTTNPELIGGAVIRAGDMVIDGSVKAQLQKLAGAVSA